MRLTQLDKSEALCTLTPITIWKRPQKWSAPISIHISRQIKWQLSSHSSRLPDSHRLPDLRIKTATWTVSATWLSRENVRLTKNISTMTITANKDNLIWCDMCKLRFGAKHPKGQTPARWIVVSETMERKGVTRSYCQPCANEVQTRHDGSTWTFREQLDYALRAEQLDGI
jgi:hypothetical protein